MDALIGTSSCRRRFDVPEPDSKLSPLGATDFYCSLESLRERVHQIQAQRVGLHQRNALSRILGQGFKGIQGHDLIHRVTENIGNGKAHIGLVEVQINRPDQIIGGLDQDAVQPCPLGHRLFRMLTLNYYPLEFLVRAK